MPDPKDNAKASGDVHPPEVEDADPQAADRSLQDEARPGKGENQAGYLKDKEAPGPGEGSRSR